MKKIAIACLLGLLLVLNGNGPAAEDRDTWQQPEKVMDALGITEGMVIGEVGCGYGYFTFKLAKRVGNSGKIYANDILAKCLKSIKKRCQKEGIKNIITIQGETENPLFPGTMFDLVMMVYVLHDLEKPVPLLRNIKPALKAGASLVILENDPEKTGSSHFYRKEKVQEIAAEAGFQLLRTETFLAKDTIYIFQSQE